jgi:hypothetical protein
VVETGFERLSDPVAFIRSHYRLGRLLDDRGDAAGARELYRTFVDSWGDGDMDRAEIADARARLAR